MQCCGRLVDITTQDDRCPQFLCSECGRQGPPSAFPDPPEPEAHPVSLLETLRHAAARFLMRLAERLSRDS